MNILTTTYERAHKNNNTSVNMCDLQWAPHCIVYFYIISGFIILLLPLCAIYHLDQEVDD